MIWFVCSKCGKTLGRADDSAGAMIFCDCGQGIVVPWESTTTAPTKPPPIARPTASPPAGPLPMKVVPVSEENVPPPRRSPPVVEREEREPGDSDRAAPGDTAVCFNHPERPSVEKCADCGESFCGDCLVKFKTLPLCGPCKNFRLRQRSRPSTVSVKAVIGVILAISSAAFVTCLVPASNESIAVLIAPAVLLGQIVATILGFLALIDTAKDPRLSGRSLAITTVLTGGLAIFMTVCLLAIGVR